MDSTLRVLPRSCCACAGVYPSSMARSIIHRLVRPGILLFIINLEWNKTSSADSPEDFITSIKTFGLTWISWTSAFRVPIPLVFDTSDSQFMVTILKDTVETRNQLLASLVASRRPRLVCTYSRLPPAPKNRSLRRSPRLFGTATLMASLQQFVPSPSVYLPCIKSQVNQGYCFQSLYYCRPHILTAILLPHKLTLPTPSKWKPRR